MADAVLLVGFLCLDDVLTCDHYPREDEDTQATGRQLYRGGNPANTSVILSQLISVRHRFDCGPHIQSDHASQTKVFLLTNFAKDGQAE